MTDDLGTDPIGTTIIGPPQDDLGTDQVGTTIIGPPQASETSFKVVISGPGGKVIFQASPLFSESRSANYEGYGITHLPTDLYAYKNTGGRKFSVTGKLVSRTVSEAQQNAMYVDLIRTWILPGFGDSGATPPILRLTAYQNNNVKGVSCIIRSYTFGMPDDVDYITGSTPPMPIIASLAIELDEIYSAEEITNVTPWSINIAASGSFNEGDASSIQPTDALFTSGFGGIASSNLSNAGASFSVSLNLLHNPSSVVSSVQLTDDLSRSAPAFTSPLIGGLSVGQISAASTLAISQNQTQVNLRVSDAFGRNTNLAPPTITGS